jgi:3-hydroxyacyl-[acyl-carrier-protein] dehydratase
MPTELLFDISKLDLTACMMDREAIGRLNPHRGVMALLDRVIWIDDPIDHGVAIKHVRQDEFWVPGHIPGYPLMPGVLMVEAGAQLASLMYYKRSGMTWFAGFTRIEDTSFRGQVLPGDDLLLISKAVKYSIKRFVSDVQGLVNGQVVFEGRFTGMAFPNVGPNANLATHGAE